MNNIQYVFYLKNCLIYKVIFKSEYKTPKRKRKKTVREKNLKLSQTHINNFDVISKFGDQFYF